MLKDLKSGCAALEIKAIEADTIAWSGACDGGLANGAGIMAFSNQGKFVESLAANFDKGVLRDGHAVVKWADGSSYDGDEAGARMEGAGLLTTSAGDRFQGQWAHDRLNGRGQVVWTNGDRYDGDWRDGKAEGHGVQLWADGHKYDGDWRNDLPDGHGVVTRKDGSRYEGTFAAGRPINVADIAAEAPAAPTPAADATQPKPAVKVAVNAPSAAASAPSAAGPGATQPSTHSSGIDLLAGKKLFAVDGSTLALTPIEGGLTREIDAPNGTVKKDVFAFVNDRQGTVSEGDDRNNVAGVFRLTEKGIATDYADGRQELLILNSAGGVSMMLLAPSAHPYCVAWYPEGHRFSAEERKAALAQYADLLGLSDPHRKTHGAPVKSACSAAAGKFDDAQLLPGSLPANPAPLGETRLVPVPLPRPDMQAELGAPPMTGKVLPVSDTGPIEVRTSTVHLIDADPGPNTLASNEPGAAAGVANETGASGCLSVETDGRHWDFRNRCAYDVQFAYCLMDAGDPLISCRQGAVAGSVAANGSSALIASQGLAETNADHDFRWVACGGGAGEVVVRLDRTDPPVGRCVRPGAS